MGGYPDIICRDGASFSSQGRGDSGIAICGHRPYFHERCVRAVKKRAEVGGVSLEVSSSPESVHQLPNHDRRKQDLFSSPNQFRNLFMSSHEQGVSIRVQEKPHFQAASSTVSNSSNTQSISSASDDVQAPIRWSSEEPTVSALPKSSVRPAPFLSSLSAA